MQGISERGRPLCWLSRILGCIKGILGTNAGVFPVLKPCKSTHLPGLERERAWAQTSLALCKSGESPEQLTQAKEGVRRMDCSSVRRKGHFFAGHCSTYMPKRGSYGCGQESVDAEGMLHVKLEV